MYNGLLRNIYYIVTYINPHAHHAHLLVGQQKRGKHSKGVEWKYNCLLEIHCKRSCSVSIKPQQQTSYEVQRWYLADRPGASDQRHDGQAAVALHPLMLLPPLHHLAHQLNACDQTQQVAHHNLLPGVNPPTPVWLSWQFCYVCGQLCTRDIALQKEAVLRLGL